MKHEKGDSPVSTTLPELLTVKEVATALRLTDARVRQLARDGRLPAVRIGERGDYRFHLEDVERLLEKVKSP